MMMMRDRFLL